MPEEPSRCPACGASVDGDTAFCHACDSLVSSTTEPVARSAPIHPAQQPLTDPSERQSPRVPVLPASTIDCWSCDAPNSPSRMFCVSCGSFIAIGSGARPTAESEPFSGPPPVPGDADADVSLPFVEGVSPLGSYALEAQRRATRRTRTMTAMASVVLATVIGGAALYLASPLGQRDTAVPQTAVVAPTEAPRPTEPTRGVSGVSIQPEAVVADPLPGRADPEPEPGSNAEPDPAAMPESAVDHRTMPEAAAEPEAMPDAATDPVAEPQAEPEAEAPPEAAAEPEPEAEPEADTLPEAVAEPEAEAVPESAVEPGLAAESAAEREQVAQPVGPDRSEVLEEESPPPYDGGWVCGEEVLIADPGDRDWSISHVSFRVRDGFERVVLHLDRVGQGSGDPTAITADSMRSDKVRASILGASGPGAGRRSVTLQLADGFSGMRGLNAYRPSGVGIIKEFSLYPVGRAGRSAVISADTDGCYRVRVPGWSDPSGSLRRAEIHVDIKP